MSIYGPETECALHHAEKESRAEGSPPPTPFDGNMAGRRITNVGPPRADTDAATRSFVANADQGVINTALGMFMALDGSTRPTADISFGGMTLKNLAGPEDEQDAVNRGYVDFSATAMARALEGKCLLRDGSNPPHRDISMGGHRLTSVAPPVHPADAANREYVDRRSPRFHYKLRLSRMRLRGTGFQTATFHIANTGGRFGADREALSISLTPEGAPAPFCLYEYRVDGHYIELVVAVFLDRVGAPDMTFHSVIEVAKAEHVSETRSN